MSLRAAEPGSHTVGRETWEVTVPYAELAFELRPRLAALARGRWLERMEEVLDDFDLPGRHVQLKRLELDLGRVAVGDLETEVERRLEGELRRVLGEVLEGLDGGPRDPEAPLGASAGAEVPAGSALPEGRILSAEEVRLELFEHCLLRGRRPSWAPRRTPGLSDQLLEIVESVPGGLEAVVRRQGRHRRVLQRLAAQLSPEAFRALLHVLEPQHAALLVAYLLDVGEAHRAEPLLPMGDRELERTLGFLTLSFLVTERGSRFNRKSYVRSLVAGLGRARGLTYEEILRAFGRCLLAEEKR
ncbi:MAG: hypothetical protein KDD47_27885, partial [Acidobacteria bacterium]|nr:hypothetical protein [Acidobacteriota bacterium]